jgi:hypothetical protein
MTLNCVFFCFLVFGSTVLKSSSLRSLSKYDLDQIIRQLELIDFGNRKHALVGLFPFTYRFSSDKAKHLICNTSPNLVRSIMRLASAALLDQPGATLKKLAFTHCVITTYRKGQRVRAHDDNDIMNSHNVILSISFGSRARVVIDGQVFHISHGQALIFDGALKHEVLPVEGSWRYNLSFRAWKSPL